MRRLMSLLPVLAVLLLVASAGLSTGAGAQSSRSVTWDRIDVTLELREDSSFHITERDRIDFSGGPFS